MTLKEEKKRKKLFIATNKMYSSYLSFISCITFEK